MALSLEFSGTGKLIMLDDGTDVLGSVSFTPTGATPTLLIIGMCLGFDIAVGAGWTLTATYGGQTMTQSEGVSNVIGQTAIWTLANPPTGRQSFVVTIAGASGVGNIVGNANCVTYAGAKLGTAHYSDIGSSTTPSLTVVGTLEASSQVYGVFTVEVLSGSVPTATVDGGETSRMNTVNGTISINRIKPLASTQAAGGNGTMNWTLTISEDWGGAVYEIEALPSGAPQMTMMGVGM